MKLKTLAVRYAGRYADIYEPRFENLRQPFDKSGMHLLFKTYISMMLFYPFVAFILSFPVLAIATMIIGLGALQIVMFSVFGSLVVGAVAFAIFYATPGQKAGNRKRNIDANLPFAVNHMAAIASSGVPPTILFKLLSSFAEYEEISKEAGKVVRNTESFGQDITTSMTQVASSTPSENLRELLYGILSVIKTGGNLKSYLSTQAEKALFAYKISREEYLETLSTYADFYTAVLIAAPLFLISILAVMNIIGGSIGGLTIQQVLSLGIFVVIPFVNIIFLIFIQTTQPEQA